MKASVRKITRWLGHRFSRESAELRAFRCNVCGQKNRALPSEFGRETPSCSGCGSTVRMRSIVHVLSTELFGESLALPDFPERKDLCGLGMSDWESYAGPLAEKLGYRNTFLHQEPVLDITDPDPALLGTLDFLISTDVYEHVAPPVSVAFENSRRLLKPGGVFVFSVPYTLEGETVEHFPELFDYRIEERGDRHVLVNRTRDGRAEEFEDLVFHGGPGETLEVRVFSLDGLRRELERAGFAPPHIYSEPAESCGMVWECGWSLTMSVRPADQNP